MFVDVIGGIRTFCKPVFDYSVMREPDDFIYSCYTHASLHLYGRAFAKTVEGRQPFRWDEPVYYIILGYLLKIAVYLMAFKVSFGKNAVFSLTTDTGIPWYMFAMAAYMVLAYVLRDGNPKIWLP